MIEPEIDIITSLPTYNKVIDIINKYYKMFTVIQVQGGQAGNLYYRIMCGTDSNFLWLDEFALGSWEDSNNKKPLDWPRKTEGYEIYDTENAKQLSYSFRENHGTTAHIGVKNIESMDLKTFKRLTELCIKNNKKLLIRSHDLHINKKLTKVPIIRIIGSIGHLMTANKTYNMRSYYSIFPEEQENIYNLDSYNFLNYDYDKFVKEYLLLCKAFELMPNISNVRAYVLLWLERLHRFNNNLP